jgi:hypothetical protein
MDTVDMAWFVAYVILLIGVNLIHNLIIKYINSKSPGRNPGPSTYNGLTRSRKRYPSLRKDFFSLYGDQRSGWPDWANFRPVGNCLLRVASLKLHKKTKCWGNFRPRKKLWINFDKNGLGYILGGFFADSSGHPVIASQILSYAMWRST